MCFSSIQFLIQLSTIKVDWQIALYLSFAYKSHPFSFAMDFVARQLSHTLVFVPIVFALPICKQTLMVQVTDTERKEIGSWIKCSL